MVKSDPILWFYKYQKQVKGESQHALREAIHAIGQKCQKQHDTLSHLISIGRYCRASLQGKHRV